jgi:iron complex outermembrane recepter protein
MTQANQHSTPLARLRMRVSRGIGVIVAVLALSPLGSPIAAAQQTSPPATAAAPETQEPAELQQVVITGTRIATPNATSTSPIQVVTSREIQISGKTDVSELLYQLPQNFNNSLGQDFSNRTSGLTTAGGLATADLRGLGPQRTLVLVNGRRLGQGDANTSIASPAPDLDQIPLLLVDRIDVVTGGASSVYGSDAIAGVINFVLKKNFEGLQVDYQIGENWHSNHSAYAQSLAQQFGSNPPTGSSTDGRTRQFNLITGANFADNRGNVTAYFGYLQQDPVTSGQRDFGACQLNSNSNSAAGIIDSLVCGGSANSNRLTPERLVSAAGVVTPLVSPQLAVVGNQLLPWPAANQNPPAAFNSQPYIYMERQDQRYTAGFLAHLDLHEWLQPYAEFGYMNDKTHQEIAPTALFENLNPNDALTNNYNVNCSNPLLSAQEFGALGCTSPTDTVNVKIGRRNAEGGGRSSDFEHQSRRRRQRRLRRRMGLRRLRPVLLHDAVQLEQQVLQLRQYRQRPAGDDRSQDGSAGLPERASLRSLRHLQRWRGNARRTQLPVPERHRIRPGHRAHDARGCHR